LNGLERMGDNSTVGEQEPQKDTFANIVTRLNETYGINLTEEDKIDIQTIRTKVEDNEEL